MSTAAIAGFSATHHEAGIERDANAPWIALDRFIRELERGRQVVDRFGTALS